MTTICSQCEREARQSIHTVQPDSTIDGKEGSQENKTQKEKRESNLHLSRKFSFQFFNSPP